MPAILLNTPLYKTGFKETYQISILTVTRNEKNVVVNKYTTIEKYDKIVVFGPYLKIKDVFTNN